MVSRRALAGWLVASSVLVACSLHPNGLDPGVEEAIDGGGLVGTPSTGGAPGMGGSLGTGGAPGTGGQSPMNPGTGGAPTGGTVGTGGVPGTGGASPADAAAPPLPPDAAPLPPDAAVLPPDAPPLQPDLAPLPHDTAPPMSVQTITCGGLKCVAGKQACCATASVTTCIPLNGVCLGSVYRCDGPEDCDGGRVCCVHTEAGGNRSACLSGIQCAQQGGAAMCRTGADCPAIAPTCSSPSASMIGVCR